MSDNLPPVLQDNAPAAPAGQHHQEGHRRRLEGNMGTFAVVFTVLAFNAPLAIVVGFVPVVIGYGNGVGAPVAYLAMGALVALFAVGFTTMSRHLPNPGAFYAYITAGLGRPLGLGAAFLALFCYFFILLGSYCYGGTVLHSLVTESWHGPDIPWWGWTIALIALCAILGYFRIDLSAKILGVALVLEIIAVVVWNAVVLIQSGPEGTTAASFEPSAIFSGSIGLAVLFGITCFGGFEATAIFREEVRDPVKTVPRATYIAVGGMAVLYAISAFSVVTAYGPGSVVAATAEDPAGAVLATFGSYLGNFAMDLVTVLLTSSVFAAVLSTHNVTSRYLYSLSVDSVLPARISEVHHSHGSPHRASVLLTVLSLVGFIIVLIAGAEPATVYASLVGAGGYGLVGLLLLTSFAIVRYFHLRRQEERQNKWKTLIAPSLAGAGLVVAIILATTNMSVLLGSSETVANIMLGSAWGLVVIGIVYALILRKRKPAVYATIGRQEG